MIYFKKLMENSCRNNEKTFVSNIILFVYFFLKLLKSDEGHICSDQLFISVFPQARLFRGQTYELLTIITKNFFPLSSSSQYLLIV